MNTNYCTGGVSEFRPDRFGDLVAQDLGDVVLLVAQSGTSRRSAVGLATAWRVVGEGPSCDAAPLMDDEDNRGEAVAGALAVVAVLGALVIGALALASPPRPWVALGIGAVADLAYLGGLHWWAQGPGTNPEYQPSDAEDDTAWVNAFMISFGSLPPVFVLLLLLGEDLETAFFWALTVFVVSQLLVNAARMLAGLAGIRQRRQTRTQLAEEPPRP